MQKNYKKLSRRNYYLERENRILRRFVENYQNQSRTLESFILIIFILRQLVIGLYLLNFFNSNNAYITIF